jgi:hypothetical protein
MEQIARRSCQGLPHAGPVADRAFRENRTFSSVPPSEPGQLSGGIGILKGMGSRSAPGARLILQLGRLTALG